MGRPRLLTITAALLLNCIYAQMEEYSPFETHYIRGENYTEKLLSYQRYVCFESCDTYLRETRACAVCHHDPQCFTFDDCCPEVALMGRTAAPGGAAPNITYSCPVIPSTGDSYFMVTSCPGDRADTETGRKCANPDRNDWRQELPVSDKTIVQGNMQTTYRNRYCAECNRVTSYSPWSFSIDCNDSTAFSYVTSADDVYSLAVHSGSCNVSVKPRYDTYARVCTPVTQALISECNVTGKWQHYDKRIERACADYKNVFYGVYRNVFCFLCNKDSFWSICDKRDVSLSSPGGVSLVAILDLRDEGQQESAASNETRTCNGTSIVHPLTCECLSLHCAVGKYVTSEGCKSFFIMTTNFGYDINLRVTITSPVLDAFVLRFQLEEVVNSLHKVLEQNFPFRVAAGRRRVLSLECRQEELVLETEIGLRVFPSSLNARDETEQRMLSWLDGRDFNATNGRFRYRLQLLEKESLSDIGAAPFEVSGCSNLVMSAVSIPEDKDDYSFILSTYQKVADGALYVPLSPLLLCRQVELGPSEFLHSNSTGSLYIVATNVTLRYPDFEVKGSSARVCEEHFNASMTETPCPKKDSHPWTMSGVLSLVCSVVSLLFLALTLLIYFLFKELRTASGVCTMGMLVVLFLAQAVFEFGAEQTEIAGLCVALGVLAHYLWLSATFWMNACTFLMFYRLMFPLAARVKLSSRGAVFARASMYAFLSPAALVACSMGAHYSLRGNLGYGGAICYIREPAIRRFALALPIACLVVVNLVLFVWTVVHLRRGCEVSSSKDSKIGLFACAKLSIITGLSWLFLFLYEAFGRREIEYVTVLLFGLHGVVLFLALVLNRHVVALFRARFLGAKDHSKSSSDVTRLTHTNGPTSATAATNGDTHL